jgi:hypothetical protein
LKENTMQIVELQNRIIRLVLDTTDEKLLNALGEILNQKNKSADYELSDVEIRRIEEGVVDYANGNTISNEAVEKDIDQWLRSK